jgi:hypothetical protein
MTASASWVWNAEQAEVSGASLSLHRSLNRGNCFLDHLPLILD